ncbi:hypothetical protein, partial [Methylibium sp.]|uniref:hypothetical protein n=1 Tax=Methylibium sp. TaxID=2067992 RepID=UPI0025E00418
AVAPHVAQAASGVTSNIAVQTVLVDLHAAAASAFWDDLQDYVRTHNIDLGPLNFIKGEL